MVQVEVRQFVDSSPDSLRQQNRDRIKLLADFQSDPPLSIAPLLSFRRERLRVVNASIEQELLHTHTQPLTVVVCVVVCV